MATSIATCKHVHRMLHSAFRSLETSLLTKNQLYYLIKKRINHEVQRKFHISSAIYAKKLPVDLSEIPVEQIRNFCIIAHVDHGKSTLADRLLEITGTIPKTASNKQVLDKLQVERERGITVKAQTASIFHEHNGKIYLLNLIDTPGHVDFNYEVSRSMKACDGVILLVDANQGIQAQTVANFFLAFESNLTVLPVINKIDLPGARPEEVKEQMLSMFEIDPEDVHLVSAKFGTGVSELLTKIIENIPPPKSSRKSPTRCLIFDSFYEQYRAAVCNVLVVDGQISKGDKIMSIATNKTYDIRDLGILYPEETPQETLYAGQVGFVVANMKKVSEAQVGDTLCHAKNPVEPLKGFKPAKQMVFAGVYPTDQSKLPNFREAIEKLTLNDSSASVIADSSPALGQGYRMGFLGLLHMDVFSQRLEQEFNASVIMTAPNVPFKVKIIGAKNIKHYGGEEVTILNPSQMPDSSIVKEYYEPLVLGTIITPEQNVYQVHELCKERRGRQTKEMKIDSSRVLIQCILPLQEILIDFFNALKAITSGYASFDYEEYGYQQADLVLMQFLLNGQPVEELTMIVNREKAREEGKAICAKLKEVIPPQLFLISIQAAIGSKILARENIKALRKDVTAKCYGGDVTRKNKLLKRQAEGKKRMRMFGKVQIPHNAFVEVLKKSV